MDNTGPESKSDERPARVPSHVAIIMDGNGRWAQERGFPRISGHKAGVETVRSIVEQCVKLEIDVLTLFAFSSENWRRPAKEVSLLMDLFMLALNREVKRLKRNNVRLRIIGDHKGFSSKLQNKILEAERITTECDGLTLQVAANYGGRWDLTQAARNIARLAADGELDPETITEETLSGNLSTAGLPDPDLFIRTGGEQRLSNFLLWQSAYAELYLTDVLWPDFSPAVFLQALQHFAGRQRRFGQTTEQVQQCSGDLNDA